MHLGTLGDVKNKLSVNLLRLIICIMLSTISDSSDNIQFVGQKGCLSNLSLSMLVINMSIIYVDGGGKEDLVQRITEISS